MAEEFPCHRRKLLAYTMTREIVTDSQVKAGAGQDELVVFCLLLALAHRAVLCRKRAAGS